MILIYNLSHDIQDALQTTLEPAGVSFDSFQKKFPNIIGLSESTEHPPLDFCCPYRQVAWLSTFEKYWRLNIHSVLLRLVLWGSYCVISIPKLLFWVLRALVEFQVLSGQTGSTCASPAPQYTWPAGWQRTSSGKWARALPLVWSAAALSVPSVRLPELTAKSQVRRTPWLENLNLFFLFIVVKPRPVLKLELDGVHWTKAYTLAKEGKGRTVENFGVLVHDDAEKDQVGYRMIYEKGQAVAHMFEHTHYSA